MSMSPGQRNLMPYLWTAGIALLCAFAGLAVGVIVALRSTENRLIRRP